MVRRRGRLWFCRWRSRTPRGRRLCTGSGWILNRRNIYHTQRTGGWRRLNRVLFRRYPGRRTSIWTGFCRWDSSLSSARNQCICDPLFVCIAWFRTPPVRMVGCTLSGWSTRQRKRIRRGRAGTWCRLGRSMAWRNKFPGCTCYRVWRRWIRPGRSCRRCTARAPWIRQHR
jgi:hypothetical protein